MKIPSLQSVSLIVVLLALILLSPAAALADDPPSLTFYDPEGDDTRLQSLGVHEHWNNSPDKQYTRNLDSGDGIEFIYSLPGGEPDYDLITVDFADVVGHGPQYYGSNIFWTEEDINLIKDRMDKSNMNIMRLYIFPYYLENPNDNSDPNSINWDGFNFDTEIPWLEKTVKYSTMFEALKDLNMYIMVDIPYLSPWLSANYHVSNEMYSTYPPNNYDEYEELVYAVLYYMVNTIGISPDKIILEPFNEPDLGCGQDPSVHCFWKNHSMDQTANTFLAAYNAAKNVSPNIRVMGMAEWNNGQYVRNFINNYNGLNYLDGITYHKYSNNYDISSLISMGTGFIDDYGLPVFVNEYGSRTWGSDGTKGALWNSYTLTNLLKNSIQPLQFPFFEYPGIGEPYESMGLFYNWNNNWQIKDSFWVYSNIIRFMKDTDILNSEESIQDLDVTVGKGNGEINILITNRDSIEKYITISIQNLPESYNNITVYDNFQENYILDSFGISGNSFEYVMPSTSSVTIAVTEIEPIDMTPPTPDPMTWASVPAVTGPYSISMTATTASDASGVEYYFDEISGNLGGSDSSWQDSTSYEDTDLQPETEYTYRVKARDKSPNQNETVWSAEKSATTEVVPEWTRLTYDDFESGWGNYTDGGGDSSLYTGSTYAHQGSNAANIQDNSGVASSFYYTDAIDVQTAGYTQIEIDFWFYPRSMESGEDFWVQYYDRSSWHTVASYASGTDFTNGQFYHETVYVYEGTYTFPTNMKIRFQCDASSNYDDVYIDEVKVSGKHGVPDDTPPTPDPMTWASVPYATGSTSIAMVATMASDPGGVEYYFDETSGNPGGSDSGWQDDTSYEDTGLDDLTQYTYTVKARDKSPNQNETGWSDPASANPETGPIVLLEDDFETGFTNWTNVMGDHDDWYQNQGSTPSSRTGPDHDNTIGDATGWYIHMETSSGYANSSGDEVIIESPDLDAATYTMDLSFYYHMHGSNIGTLNVDVYDGSWHDGVWSISGQQHSSSGASYSRATVDLDSYIGTIRLRFRGVAAGGYMGDMAIDDIEITGVTRGP